MMELLVWSLLLLSLWSLSGRSFTVSFNNSRFRNRRKLSEQGSESSDVASISRLLKSPMKPPRRKKTLVLDLDETLVHSSSRQTYRQDLTVEVMVEKQSLLYYVYQRPHCDYFLEKVQHGSLMQQVSEWYRVTVFTASVSDYADPVIDFLDKRRGIIQGRYFREVFLYDS